MQQRTGNAPSKKKPPKRGPSLVFQPGLDPFNTRRDVAPKTPPKLRAPTAPFKPGTKPFEKREAVNQNKVITNRREKKGIANRVLAQTGGPATSKPFGPGSTPAPARDKFVPQLTARSELAQANHARVLQGGLLTPAQLKRERTAEIVVRHAPTFHDTHALPDAVTRPDTRIVGTTPRGRTEATPSKARGLKSGKPFAAGALDWASKAAGTALELAASVPETALRSGTPANIRYSGGSLGSSVHPAVEDVKPTRLPRAIGDTSTRLADVGNEAADYISRPDVGMPKGRVKLSDIQFPDPAAEAAVTKAAKGGSVEIAALGGAYLTPEAKKREDAKAMKRGWFAGELENLNGLETMRRANADPPGLLERVARNWAGDVFRSSAAPAMLVGVAREVASGHGMRAGEDLLRVAGDQTVGTLTHPVQSAVSHPGYFVPAVGIAGRTAGLTGLLRRGARAPRLIDTGFKRTAKETAEEAAVRTEQGLPRPQEPVIMHRGTYSRNLWNEIGERGSDALARRRVGKGRVLRTGLDRDIRNAVNQQGADLATTLHAYSKAHRGLGYRGGRKRAEILLRLADTGGRADVVLAYYEKRALEDGPHSAAAGQARYIREHVLGHKLSAEDEAFMGAHEALSRLVSGTHVELGRFGETAAEFRRHEALIRSLAELGDKDAKKLLELRAMAHGDVPPDVSVFRTGKQREAQGTLDKVVKEHEALLERAAEPKPPRPPKGSGKESQQQWQRDLGAWKKRTKTAKDQAKVIGRRRKDAENRLGTLGASEMSQAMNTPLHERITQAYAQAVEAFAQDHLTHEGAFRPHYVERVRVKDAGAVRKGQTRGKLGFTNRVAKQHASSGETFRGGEYLIDSQAPLRNAMHAMRMRQTRTVFEAVRDKYGIAHDGNEVVPEGYVSVDKNTLTSLNEAISELPDNPVSHQDYFAEESAIRTAFESKVKGESVHALGKAKKPGYFIPKPIYDRMLDYIRPESQHRYDRFLRQYQRALISTSPSTIVGNTAGSIPLAIGAGAIPFKSHAYADAWRALHDPELGPLAMRGKGAASGLAGDPHNVVGRYMDFMRRQSVKGEDFSRLAAFFSKASPFIRKQADELNMDVDVYLKKFVRGEIDEDKLSEFLTHAEKFLGDTVRPNGKFGRQAGHLILFHNWVGHMMKVMLYTLPVQHPGRATLLNIMGQYGDEYRQEHGVWPQWMTAYLPLMHYTDDLGVYGPQNFTVAADLTQFTPQGTAGGVMDQATQDRSILENVGNILAPPWGQALQLGLIDKDIREARPGELNTPDFGRAALATGLGMIPNYHKAFTMTGQRADSLPFARRPKMYLAPHGGHVQSPFLQSGSFPLGGRPGDPAWMKLVGFGSRVAGAGLREVPNEGRITRDEVTRTKIQNRKGKSGDKSAKRRKKRYQGQYQRALNSGP